MLNVRKDFHFFDGSGDIDLSSNNMSDFHMHMSTFLEYSIS